MMRSTQCSWGAVAVLALAVGLLAVPANAGPSAVAAATVSPLGIHFQPSVQYQKMTLTVSGPEGLILRREFAAGAAISFEAVGDDGSPLPDGAYTYELVAAPVLDRATRRALAAARQSGDDAAIAKLQAAGKLPRTPMVQSGAFKIAGGALVQDDLEEPANRGTTRTKGLTPTTSADQVIPDDLIVQGSLCVGFDCVNNESFGFDTIRLKENNTRIKFEDTSVGTFPTTDWQLTANDSASGGSNKFSIEDITGAKVPFTITGGASTNSIFVDSTGRVGFRTSTPVLDLHVSTSNTPALRLEQTSAGGFTAQTWDIAGNEANFFVRDVTSGSRLPLRIRPGAPTSSIDIAADGDVGIGTASPDVRMDVKVNTANVAVMRLQQQDATGFSAIEFLEPSTTTETVEAFVGVNHTTNEFQINSVVNNPLALRTNSVEHLRIESDGDVGINCNAPTSDLVIASGAGCSNPASNLNAGATSFTATSSRTIKENLAPVRVPEILEKISAIDVYNYDFIGGPKDRVGLMAEDFHQIFKRGSDKLLDGQEVEMALWLAVKELTSQNKELTERLAALEAKLAAEKGNTP